MAKAGIGVHNLRQIKSLATIESSVEKLSAVIQSRRFAVLARKASPAGSGEPLDRVSFILADESFGVPLSRLATGKWLPLEQIVGQPADVEVRARGSPVGHWLIELSSKSEIARGKGDFRLQPIAESESDMLYVLGDREPSVFSRV